MTKAAWWLVGGAVVVAAVAGVAAVVVVSPGSAGGPPTPRFAEEPAAAGIEHAYDGEFTFFVGGGVAAFDCDDDGKPDLYLAGGEAPAALYRNESEIGGELRFEAVPDPVTDLAAVTGAYPLDVDGDGLTDLAVLRLGENVLLRGRGDCRFERTNDAWGFDGGEAWTTAFSATWEGAAELPTLAFANYLVLDERGASTGECADGELVRPAGASYGPPVALTPGWCALSALFSDWDRSGRADLRISNDRHYYRDGEEQLWRVADGEPPRLYTRDDGWRKLQIWGMGIASHDLTGDGRPEVFLTSQGDNKLQALADDGGAPAYEDIALARGVTAHRPTEGDLSLPSTAWHADFQDVNNDGLVDLYVAKGNVEAMPEFAAEDPSNLLLGRPDGTFVDRATEAGVVSAGRSRGAALVDFTLAGLLDLVEVNRRENVKVWRNVSPDGAGNWVAVRLRQDGANRDAIGSWIEVRAGGTTQTREVSIGGGHGGDQLGWVHLGLGDAEDAELRVQWPDGEPGPWLRLSANGFYVVERGAAEPDRWLPGQ